MGFLSSLFGGSKDNNSQTTNADQIGASEQGQVATATSVAARDGAVSLGGSSNRNNLGGEINASGYASITVGDAGAYDFAKSVLETYNGSLSDLVNRQAVATKETTGVLAKLFETKTDAGDTERNRVILYIGLAMAAVLAIFFWRSSR